jgi:hypothetical protein
MRTAPRPPAVPAGLERLNELSLTRSFTPQTDIDWSADTSDAEFAALYDAMALLSGTGADAGLDARGRALYARYQQIGLMTMTGLVERHGIAALARLYDLEPERSFAEYIGHFIKEEVYHYSMFLRAAERLSAGLGGLPPLPTRGLDRAARWLFAAVGWLPGRRLRAALAFTFFRFTEQLTMYIHQTVQECLPRRDSLAAQVWALHARDEARHLAFDALVLERNRLGPPLHWLPTALAAPACAGLALLMNANEVWAARQLGLKLSLWQVPALMRRTRAPFKRRAFGLLAAALGRQPEGA